MDKHDDILEHYGVLGMKWGKRKKLANNPVDKAAKFLKETRLRKNRPNPVNDKLKAIQEKRKQRYNLGDKVVNKLKTTRFRNGRPNPVDDAVKSLQKKNDVRTTKIADKYHEKNKNKLVYKKLYGMNLKRFEGKSDNPHKKAVFATRSQIRKSKAAIAIGSMIAARAVYGKVVTPNNIKRGMNLAQALKRSPVRYTNASMYKDVIDI